MLQVSFWNIAFTIINILILYFLIHKFLFKPIHRVLAQRKADIQKQYDDAAAKEKSADDLKKQYEETMKNVDQAKEQGLADAKKRADAEYDRIIASANAESDKIVAAARDKAKAAAGEEKRKAEDEIVSIVKETANQIAAADSDTKLYDTFLGKVSKETAEPDNN